MINHVGVTNVARQANRRIPISHNTPLGIDPGSLMTGSKQVDHWTSGTVCECSEIEGSPHPHGFSSIHTWALFHPQFSWDCDL
jgi:hypothetical protein